MVVRDSLFDALLFGVLALALLADAFFGAHLGVATMLAVGLATYFAAQELSRAIARRGLWSQESLATSVALSVVGYFYYTWQNGADIILVALSIGFMMTALMMMIAGVAALGAAIHGQGLRAIVGWFAEFAGAVLLGCAAGLLVLVLVSEAWAWPIRFAVLMLGCAIALIFGAMQKSVRAKTKSSTRNAEFAAANALSERAQNDAHLPNTSSADTPVSGWSPMPQNGSLLHRFVPILLVGALAFAILLQTHRAASLAESNAHSAPSTVSN